MSQIKFTAKSAPFFIAVNKDVRQYFREKNIKSTGNFHLYFKTFILLSAMFGLYFTMLFANLSTGYLFLNAAALGFAMALVGFNVMHDSAHGSFSQDKTFNNVMSHTMNLLGSTAFYWKQTHNVLHHTYTNIDGIDDDIAMSPVFRFCEQQPQKPIHKFQHLYAPILYALASFNLACYADFLKYFKGKIMDYELPKMDFKQHFLFWITKIALYFNQLALPIYFLGWMNGILCFLICHFVLGFVLIIVFQLAHVVEIVNFTTVAEGNIQKEWAVHQIETTADFATENSVLSWFLGGLNFQVEHHLFPQISHVHYPAVHQILKKKCAEFNIPFHEYTSFTDAVISHIRHLKYLGNNPVTPALSTT